jgi:methyl-galactoside transport system substrate-binding protein
MITILKEAILVKKMKALTLALVTGMVGASLVGCSSTAKKTDGSASSSKPTIGVAIYKYDDTFMTGVRNAISQAAEGKATLDMVDSQNSQPTQNDKVDLFLTKHEKALIINPVDRTAAGTIIDKAKAESTPVVFINREPEDSDMAKWDKVYYVGAKPEESGILQGQILADYWKAHPEADKNHDGMLEYVMLTGEPGHPDAVARTKYSIQALTDAGIKSKQLASDTAMWDRQKAQDKMAAFLTSNGDKIEAVLANNDDMALGAIEALKAAGYFQSGKNMPVVGVDATAPGIAALKDGTLLGTVLNDAKNQGTASFKIADLLSEGKTPTKETIGFDISDGKYVWVPYKKITKDNIADAQ